MTPRRRHGLAATCLLLLALVAVSCSSTPNARRKRPIPDTPIVYDQTIYVSASAVHSSTTQAMFLSFARSLLMPFLQAAAGP